MMTLSTPGECLKVKLPGSTAADVINVVVSFMYHRRFNQVRGNTAYKVTGINAVQKILWGPDAMQGESVEPELIVFHNRTSKKTVVELWVEPKPPYKLVNQVPAPLTPAESELRIFRREILPNNTWVWAPAFGWQRIESDGPQA